MTSHRDCTHPATKAARARCRKNRADIQKIRDEMEAEDRAYYEAYIRPYEEQEAARKVWEEESAKFCDAHIASAHQNADDTSVEDKFELYSKHWYEVAVSTLHSARDNAYFVEDPKDPQEGDAISWGNDYRWVAKLTWGEGWVTHVTLIDREGNLEKISVDDLKAEFSRD